MVHVSFYLPPDHLARLREIAGENVQVASLMRLAIKRFLKDFDSNPVSALGLDEERNKQMDVADGMSDN